MNTKNKQLAELVANNMDTIVNSDKYSRLFVKTAQNNSCFNPEKPIKNKCLFETPKASSFVDVVSKLLVNSEKLDDLGYHKSASALLCLVKEAFQESEDKNNKEIQHPKKKLLNKKAHQNIKRKPSRPVVNHLEIQAINKELDNFIEQHKENPFDKLAEENNSSDVMFALDENDSMMEFATTVDVEAITGTPGNLEKEHFEDES